MRELTTVLGNYPCTRPLKDGRVTSDHFLLRFTEFAQIWDAFGEMCEKQPFDACEMAIGAFLQARAAKKPITLLPIVVMGGIHHGQLWYLPDNGAMAPEQLPGKRVAIRSYSQTTGLWVRGILQEEYGVEPESMTWVTNEGSHVAGYKDPSNVERAPEGVDLTELLRSGTVDAVVTLHGIDGAEPLIPNIEAAQRAWYERHGTVGINHLVALRDDLVQEHPETVCELYEMLKESIIVSRLPGEKLLDEGPAGLPSPVRSGVGNIAEAMEIAIRYAHEQHLIPTEPAVKELFPNYLLDV